MPTSAEMARALDGVTILEAPSAEDEAEAVALILREVAETPGRTAALVTPDRTLARRVAVAAPGLGRDGRRLRRTRRSPPRPSAPSSILIVEAAARRFEPVALVSLLKHSLCRLGLPAEEYGRGLRALELAAFRAPYFGQGLEGVAAALERAQADLREGKRRPGGVSRLKSGDWQAAAKLVKALELALRPLEALFQSPAKAALSAIAAAHAKAAEALADPGSAEPADSVWQGKAGEAAAKLFATLLDAECPRPTWRRPTTRSSTAASSTRRQLRCALRPTRALPSGSLTSRACSSPTSSSWARSTRARGRAPPTPAPGSTGRCRPSSVCRRRGAHRRCSTHLHVAARHARGLSHPRRQGRRRAQRALALAAAAAGAARGPAHDGRSRAAVARLGAGAQRARRPRRPVKAPEPRPALELRPRRLSVTAIEKWIANPYAIYAERILRLEALPLLGRPPDAALRGQIVHDALGRFADRFPQALPADTCAELVALAERGLTELTGSPRVAAFWAPRFARFAAWFAETEPAPARRRRAQPRRGGGQPRARGRRQAVHAHRPRRPHRRRQGGARHHRLQDRRQHQGPGAAPGRARPRSCRSRRRSRSPEGSPACPRAQSRRCATSRAPAASRRAWSTSSRTATWQRSPAARAKAWSG